jgi:hypothetical protein
MGSDRTPVPARDRLPCRLTDRVEDAVAWFLTAAALILVVAAGITGFAMHNRQVERAEVESATRWPTSAVLLEDAPLMVGGYGERLPVQVAARWTDRTGTEHTGMVTSGTAMSAGSVVEIWLDEEGRVVDRPVQLLGAVLFGIGAAGGVLAIGGALLYALWAAVRSLTAAANDRRWEREWAHVEPEWRSRHFR